MRKQLTLCIPIRENKIILGMKKRGFGVGRWNGFGGKIKQGETIKEGAMRELFEESGIKNGTLEKVGKLDFSFKDEEDILEVHIFKLTNFDQEPFETEEMRPKWFSLDEIPFSQMWSDDSYWFPYFLQNKLFKGFFLFDKPSDTEHSATILEKRLEEVIVID